MRHRLILTLFFLATAGRAQDVVYVLRQHGFPEPAQGFWQFSIASREYQRLHAFNFQREGAGPGLQSFHDRVVVQAQEYLEFDRATGRLLRQYQGAQEIGGSNIFVGTLVTPAEAARSGVLPGYYGFPRCLPSLGPFQTCDLIDLPGYGGPSREVRNDLLYHRSADPANPKLMLVAQFSDDQFARRIAFDAARDRFWVWAEGSNAQTHQVIRLSYLPIQDGIIGAEVIVDQHVINTGTDLARGRLSIAYSMAPSRNHFLQTFQYFAPSDKRLFVQQDLSLQHEEVLGGGTAAASASLPTAIAVPPQLAASTHEQVIPAIQRGQDARGFWQTDVFLHNPSPRQIVLSLRRVSAPAQTVTRNLPPHGSLVLEDVLALFGVTQAPILDALVITAPAGEEQLVATARVYHESSIGRVGHTVPAVPGPTGYTTHLPYFSDGSEWLYTSHPEFVLDYRTPGQFVHRIGIVNDSPEPLRVTMRYGVPTVALAPGAENAQKEITIAPHSVHSVLIEDLFSPDVRTTRGPRVWLAAQRPTPTWLTMLDTTSGDTTFVPYTTFALQPGDTMTIPVARIKGKGGIRWHTDLYGFFPPTVTDNLQRPSTTLHSNCGTFQGTLEGVAGPPAPAGQQWIPYWRAIFPNVTAQLAPCEDVIGSLELPAGSWMAAYSRTYITMPNGGTVGDMLPLHPTNGWPTQAFAGVRTGHGARANVGLYNGHPTSATYTLRLYTDAGELAAQQQVTVPPTTLLHQSLEQLLGPLPAGLYGLRVVAEGAARTWAHVSVIDNTSSDPTNLW